MKRQQHLRDMDSSQLQAIVKPRIHELTNLTAQNNLSYGIAQSVVYVLKHLKL